MVVYTGKHQDSSVLRLYCTVGPPDAPKKCGLSNQTASVLMLVCSPGYDGGLTQQIHLELFTSSQLCIANMTGRINQTGQVDSQAEDTRDLHFTVSKLPADQEFHIVFYASNVKGKSKEKYLTVATLPLISGETGQSS